MLAVEGHADHPVIRSVPHRFLRLGAAREAERLARTEEIEEVVLAGWVRRPSLREIRPDARALRFLLKVGFRALGDDSLLSSIIKEIEAEGLRVVGVQDIVSDLLAPAGRYGKHAPDDEACKDIDRGLAVAKGIGALDVGQAVVVQQGIVLGVEAIEGTDELLRRAGRLRRPGPGGVLVKIKKPGQERRVDLPTIGVATVAEAAAAGLRGIAVEARATIVLDQDDVVAAADAAGLFVIGLELGTANGAVAGAKAEAVGGSGTDGAR